jgi:cell division protein FtsQ
VKDPQPMPVVRGAKPRRRGSRKLLLLLFLFFVSVMGVLFFQSSFSKIERIDVKGNHLLSVAEIIEAAGVHAGDHFFAVGSAEMKRRIEAQGAVESASVKKSFPGRVLITVKEHPVVALELDKDGRLAGVLSNGISVEYAESSDAAPRPLLTGWKDAQLKTRLAKVLKSIPPAMLHDVSEIRPSPTSSYSDRILLYTRSQFEVVTRIDYLAEKITLLDDYIYEMKAGGRTTGRIILLETNYGEGLDAVIPGNSNDSIELEKESIQ